MRRNIVLLLFIGIIVNVSSCKKEDEHDHDHDHSHDATTNQDYMNDMDCNAVSATYSSDIEPIMTASFNYWMS